MSNFKYFICALLLFSSFVLIVSLATICHAQYYEDDCYSDNVYGGYYDSDTIIVDEYDAYTGYKGYSSYDTNSDIINHYDVETGYSGFSTVSRSTGIIEHYENGVGYRGYSQVYLGR